MQSYHRPYAWKRYPFARLLLPFIIGIVLEWYVKIPFQSLLPTFLVSAALSLVIFFLRINSLYRWRWLPGLCMHVALVALGAIITYQQDIRNNDEWLGHFYKDTGSILVTIQEPLVEKAKSYKAEATTEALFANGKWTRTTGRIIIYFQKDSVYPNIVYGSQIILSKSLQPIKNSGNPGAFDYERYNAFKDIHYQVYLKAHEYQLLSTTNINPVNQWLFGIQKWVVALLQKRIKGSEESGVAEALLIGYRNDLDKDLVQAYSNTGVVHIIAISGLHLAVIYGVLVFFLRGIKNKRLNRILKPVIVLLVLWTFSLVAGAAPSIVRSAVMFSFIVAGEILNRKGSMYNTLAGAAFIMLTYNPFYLWDVGFQLSFGAVLSIIAFVHPIYKWFYIKNKFLDMIWKLSSVTLAAQVLTAPLIFYYFHQFPLLFMVTNFIAVPLSSFILYLELLLIVVSPIDVLADLVGAFNSFSIHFMNAFIRHIDQLPNVVYDNIHVSLLQTYVAFAIIMFGSYWLLFKSKQALFGTLVCIVLFVADDAYENYLVASKDRLVVYNVPQHEAIDVMEEGNYRFLGDTAVLNDAFLQNFHLKPSRIVNRIDGEDAIPSLYMQYPFAYWHGKHILFLDRPLKFETDKKIPVDVIVISKNPKIYIKNLASAFDCKQYVFDASNPLWKINLWKKDCDSLHLRHHSTPDKGAFVMEL
jgi:competence protein ComEC